MKERESPSRKRKREPSCCAEVRGCGGGGCSLSLPTSFLSPSFLQALPELHPCQARVTETLSCHCHYGFRPPLVLFGVARIDKTAFTRREHLPALSCQLGKTSPALPLMVVMIVEAAIDIAAWFWVVLLFRCISIVALDSKWNYCCYCHESRGREVVVGDAAA
ncbi:hypothetical protein PIB30_088419 [Stylosanthes scabra]|uniref:Uncharacterized protein n=1 Tax=Stylosanthes scabra TaxID=79078 RepID=A0ABU6SUK9_9FABA|nr:hypothetical protein [Stylosanthes scabra]